MQDFSSKTLLLNSKIRLFVYFWLCWVFVAVQTFSSCGEWGLLSSCGRGPLIVVASLVAEHGL